jgi:hypothetical protein
MSGTIMSNLDQTGRDSLSLSMVIYLLKLFIESNKFRVDWNICNIE